MGYATRVEGTLWIEPFPAAEDMPLLRETLASTEYRGGVRLALTPLGHGLVVERAFDWEDAVAALTRARETVFAPRGLGVGGVLRAVGEDEAHLATVTFAADGVHVERAPDEDEAKKGVSGPARPESQPRSRRRRQSG